MRPKRWAIGRLVDGHTEWLAGRVQGVCLAWLRRQESAITFATRAEAEVFASNRGSDLIVAEVSQ